VISRVVQSGQSFLRPTVIAPPRIAEVDVSYRF